jgi:membrane protease YdiL (CAAX protease family)
MERIALNEPVSEPQSFPVPWTDKQTFTGVFWTVIPLLALDFGLSFLNTGGSTVTKPLSVPLDWVNAIVTFVLSVLLEGAFLIAPYYYARIMRGRSLLTETRSILSLLGFRRFNVVRSLLLVIALFLFVLVINEVYQFVITALHLNLQTNDQVVLDRGKTAPVTTYATLLVAAVVAPFCEEVFFRSFVFMGLRNGMSLVWAIVFSALIFGVAHGDIASFPVLFFIGLALAVVRWQTDSIWPGMILHALNNGLSALLIVLAMHGVQV